MNKASQRAARAEARRVKAGGRVVRVILSPEAARALGRLAKDGRTMRDAIEGALLDASPPTPASDAAGFLAAAAAASRKVAPRP